MREDCLPAEPPGDRVRHNNQGEKENQLETRCVWNSSQKKICISFTKFYLASQIVQ
jgi:hypothetical protein